MPSSCLHRIQGVLLREGPVECVEGRGKSWHPLRFYRCKCDTLKHPMHCHDASSRNVAQWCASQHPHGKPYNALCFADSVEGRSIVYSASLTNGAHLPVKRRWCLPMLTAFANLWAQQLQYTTGKSTTQANRHSHKERNHTLQSSSAH